MKKIRYTLVICVIFFLCLLASSVSYAKSKKCECNTLSLSCSSITMCVDQVKQLEYNILDNKNTIKKKTDAIRKKLVWNSSDKKIVSINKKGELKGKKVGKAKVTVWLKGLKDKKVSCNVNIIKFKEMNRTIPINEVKYIELPLTPKNSKSNIHDTNFAQLFSSENEFNDFTDSSDLDEKLKVSGYDFSNVDYKNSNVFVYSTMFRCLASPLCYQINYNMRKQKSNIVLNINICESDLDYSDGKMYADFFTSYLIFEIIPKKSFELANKLNVIRNGISYYYKDI